ncbi:hypothetical protein QFZ89_008427 [Paraburkholderia youngii]
MSEKCECICYEVEPNPDRFARLGGMVRVKPSNLAIANRAGTMSFFVATNREASSFVRTSENNHETKWPLCGSTCSRSSRESRKSIW